MQPLLPSFIVLSAATNLMNDQVNREQTGAMAAMLKELGYAVTAAEGMFRGVAEPSLIVWGMSEQHGLAIARDFNQSHILTVDGFRNAALVATVDGSREYIGRWRATPDATGDYTLVNGIKYSCEKI